VIREIHKELKKYNLKIVIMHIKTDEMYQTVKKYNFDAYQGFGIERPLPISLNTTRD
jgi:EAL domain-containing protein (putative c-di-GMP-specific phosphodiesterase class I)